jgi:hypothetical protein
VVTIGEKDGTIHKQPAYGKDMQGALSRLINKERTVKVEKKLENNTGIIFLSWLLIMGVPAAFFGGSNTPWMLVYTMGTIILVMTLAAIWYHHIKKGE